MKNPIRILLFASALASLSNHAYAQTGAAVQFADPNFESSVRSQVEKGWIWVWGYTGNDYQFKPEDLISTWSLFLDSDDADGAFTSLADLQYFPNLQGLYIENASKITDFSPIWQLKDTLEYLQIEGARSPDFSGMSQLSKLRSLDLESCQLTNLNFLGSFPQLTELYLTGNYLDLSNSAIEQTLLNFNNLIQSNRANQGWSWWYSDAVEVEPQLPKSFQNLTSEMARVQNANDPQANLLKGIHALLHIVESTEATALKEFAVAVGVAPSIRQFTLSDLPMLENYSHTLNRDFNSGKLAELFQDSIIPSLEQADTYFSNIPSGSLITLTQDLTGTEELVTVDYADVLILRSIVKLMATLASMQSAYDWNLNAGFIDDLEDNPDPNVEITAETLRTHNSDFGGIRDAGQLAKAKQFLDNAITIYNEASPILTEPSRLDKSSQTGEPSPDRLFVLSSHYLSDEQEFRDALDELQKALDAPYELKDDDWGLNALLASDGVPSSGRTFFVESVNSAANRDLLLELYSNSGNGWSGAELLIRDSASKIVYNTTLHQGSESRLRISLPANENYSVEVSGGQNIWDNWGKYWEIYNYDVFVHSDDNDNDKESEIIDLRQLFAGKVDLAKLLPQSVGNKFTTDEVTDPTLGGLLPNWTQRRVSDEMQADGLVPPKYEIVITAGEHGNVVGAGTYSEGQTVTFTATPNAGYMFSHWEGDFNGTSGLLSPWTFKASVPLSLQAVFAKLTRELPQLGDFSGAAKLEAGENMPESFFIKDDGSLMMIDGNGVDSSTPSKVADDVLSTATGYYHHLFLKKDGVLWGTGNKILLGKGTPEDDYATSFAAEPVEVAKDVVVMTAGGFTTFFIDRNGTLWGIGDNGSGLLGLGRKGEDYPLNSYGLRDSVEYLPVPIASDVVAVNSGNGFADGFTYFFRRDGSLWGMGDNSNGQLGIGKSSDDYPVDDYGNPMAREVSPVKIAEGVAEISAGASHGLFIKDDGSLWGMGNNSMKQLGSGKSSESSGGTNVEPSIDPALVGTKLWEFETGGRFSSSSPAIGSDGTVYVGSDDNKLYAINGKTGDKLWEFETGDGVESSPAIGSDGTVYVGSEDGKLYAVNGQTGVKLWEFEAGHYVTSSPAIGSDGTVYVGSADPDNNKLYAISGQTGVKLWEFETGDTIHSSSPAIGSDGTVYVGSDDNKFYAINGQTGVKLWEFETRGNVSSPAIGSDGTVYVGTDDQDNKLYAINGQTGVKLWEFEMGGAIYFPSPAIGSDGTVYVGSSDNKLYAVNGQTGVKLWELETVSGGNSSSAIGSDGTVYVGSGKLYAVNGKSGVKLWEFETGGAIFSSPAIGPAGTVYVTHMGGQLYAIQGSSGPADSPWPMFGQNAQRTGRIDSEVPFVVSPIKIAEEVEEISAGYQHSLFIDKNGTLWGMGANGYGQLGVGKTLSDYQVDFPWEAFESEMVRIADDVDSVSAGGLHSLFFKKDGSLWAMGNYLSSGTTETSPLRILSDDPRSFVFWRYEREGSDPVNYNNKESLILKSLSDGSEEVLYSINSKDLTAELNLGSNGASTNGLWIEESKVHVSPDGSTMIFGFDAVGDIEGKANFDSRKLVRIVAYDMSTRKASVIREWVATGTGEHIEHSDDVDFAVGSLAVDWVNELVYFAEVKSVGQFLHTARLVSCELDGSGIKAIKEFDSKVGEGSYSAEIEQIHLGSSDGNLRVLISYPDSQFRSPQFEEIYKLKVSGGQEGLPIENEDIGYSESSTSESFEPFSMTSDGSKILFAKYESRNSAVGEPGKVSLLSLTKEGYDKQAYWNYDGNQSGAWNPSAGRTNPRITAMSDEKNGKIILVMEDQSTMAGSSNNLKAPELVELDVATGAAVTLVRGRQTLDAQGMGYLMRDDLETGFLFSSSGTIEPPNESTKDTDGDGLPDEVEIAAGMDPDSSDKQVVDAVYNYFFERDGSVAKDLVAATPHTYQWYYQPEWGWIWTNEKIFPYVYRSSADGQTAGWLYFSQKSANPIRFYDYAAKKWVTLGE